jgi:predicted RecB family nuclease
MAERSRDVALVPGVDRALALDLYSCGIRTYDDLSMRVDTASPQILQAARAMATNTEIVLQRPVIPPSSCYVMFDLEGLPPQLDELEKVYLWGMQTRGDETGPYMGVCAGFGEDGDREGWHLFLSAAQHIFERHGDVPFVHWAAHDKRTITRYVERFGDRDGVAQRVTMNLLDLLAVTQSSIALPLPSYSLKVVEKHVGFERALPEAHGEWSVAAFIEAVETHDEDRRRVLMEQIRQYNREDLGAMWAVQTWLQRQGHGPSPPGL